MDQKKGFSMIELLVVMGILVILFSIIYPAITKSIESAHKTHALSNLRHLSAAFLQYAADHEGRLPYAFAWNEEEETWRFDVNIPKPVAIPSGWHKRNDSEEEKKGDLVHWSHSVFRYTKSFEVYEAPSLPLTEIISSKGTSIEPARCSFTYNGLLHNYPLSSVQNPSQTPILWTGLGRTTLIGFAASNPFLHCTGKSFSGDCQYKPVGGPKGSLFGIKDTSTSTQSMWVYEKRTPVSYIDGSAKMQKYGSSTQDPLKEPFPHYDEKGVPVSYYSNNVAPNLFRPDQE